ncbi:hypothetical protein ACIBG8_19865 [Nonomuraea sp. NPDC050556]|uniref:hypothetical protein n=1 Tax=Nonomuraea sp. NPDC050556 TaxID=3364369 RepID=UPI00379EB83C
MRVTAFLLSLGFGALAAVAAFTTSSLILLTDYLNHPYLFGVLACLLLAFALHRTLRPRWARVTAVVLLMLPVCALTGLGALALAFGGNVDVTFVDGPDPLRVQVRTSMAGLGPDTLVRLDLRSEAGLFTRQWPLACFNDDVVDDAYDSLTWTGPRSLDIRVNDGRVFSVRLDPLTGEPLSTPSAGYC